MNIPGLDKQLYGMTKEEAFLDDICISCKKIATWYSLAGAKDGRRRSAQTPSERHCIC